MPIPVRPKPFLTRRCLLVIYAGLARLSAGCPPDRGRLHTCYSPVRHSPARRASSPPAAVRLACVKPAASVHPEPGSNSPLLVIYFYIYLRNLFVPAVFRMESYLTGNPEFLVFPCLLQFPEPFGSALLVLWHHVIVLNLFGNRSTAGLSSSCPVVSRLRMQNYCFFSPCASPCNFFFTFLQFFGRKSLSVSEIKIC